MALKTFLQGRPLRQPLHPILVHFAVGLFVLALVLDLLSLVLEDGGEYLVASLYVMTGGFAAGVLALPPGMADLLGIRRDSRSFRTGLLHLLLMVLVLAAFGLNLWLRWGPWDVVNPETAERVSGWSLLLTLVGVALLGAGGYLGGRMVYGDGVGVGRHRRTTPPPRKTIKVSAEGSPDGFVTVARDEELGEGETLRVSVDGRIIAVARVRGDVYALGEFCTHRFGPLSEGSLHDCGVQCPWHRSEFHVRTGEVQSGPAKAPIPSFPVEVEEGEIRVNAGVE